MGATTPDNLPWPEMTDAVNVSGDVKKLADAVQAAMTVGLKHVQSGTTTFTVGNNAGDEGSSAAITFNPPFKSTPHVVVGGGPTSLNVMDFWIYSLSATQLVIRARREAGGGNATATWIAVGEV